ncbi:hypothetical protein ACSBR1_042872 [Camellia fascicularis]
MEPILYTRTAAQQSEIEDFLNNLAKRNLLDLPLDLGMQADEVKAFRTQEWSQPQDSPLSEDSVLMHNLDNMMEA